MPAIGYRTSLNQAKQFFFDRKAVTDEVDRIERQAMSRFGYFVMRNARQNIRRRKTSSTSPHGPTNQTGLLKSNIFFFYDKYRSSVVIGPVKLPNMAVPDVPRTLEKGGWTKAITYDGGRRQETEYYLKPRRYMDPAYQREKKNLREYWHSAI